mmetsp:Transcript_8096/g.7167  ORF Transcript_8096/g.7167 Transcript_8096/m.7167 type:complete len:331 (-) Transcript_8096:335-1327(-)
MVGGYGAHKIQFPCYNNSGGSNLDNEYNRKTHENFKNKQMFLKSEIDPRKLESLLSAPNGENDGYVNKETEFNPRDTQTDYNKTRLPQINNEPRKQMMSPEPKYYSKKQENYFIDPTEVSTHESSHRPIIDSRGIFSDYRNSMNLENDEYHQIKQSMDNEVKESPSFKFGDRKCSLKNSPPNINQILPPQNLSKNNSTGKLRVFKIQMEGNKFKKKEIKHQDFLAEISKKKTRNPMMYQHTMDDLARTIPHQMDINNAIKSLSPQGRKFKINTKNIQTYQERIEDSERDNSPLALMNPSTATLKKERKTSKNPSLKKYIALPKKFIKKFD